MTNEPMTNEPMTNEPRPQNLHSHEDLYKLIQDLTYRCQILEGKVQLLTQKRNQKKKHIHPNKNPNNKNPIVSFEIWCKFNHSPLYKNQKIIQLLLEEDTQIQTIFQIYLQEKTKKTDPPLPMQRFDHSSHFYIFKEEERKWEKMSHQNWCTLLQTTHSQILKIICEWKRQNTDTLNQNEKLNEAFNKMLIKFMGANVTGDSFIASIRKNWM